MLIKRSEDQDQAY